MAQKITGLTEYTFQQGSIISQKEISIQDGEILLEILLMDTRSDSPVCFTMLTNNISSNPIPFMVVPFILVPVN